jgi:Tfp pilus assembly protein PilF
MHHEPALPNGQRIPACLAVTVMALAAELMRKESRILDDPDVHIPILVADHVWDRLVAELQQRITMCWSTSGTAETEAHMQKMVRRLRERCFRITESSYSDWKTMAKRRLTDVDAWPTMALALAAHAHSGNAAIMVAQNALIGDLAILSCGVPAWSSYALHRELDEAPPSWYNEYFGGTPSEPPAPELDASTLIGALQAPTEQAPQAARSLGVLLAEQGDVEGARAAFQQAIASGHPDEAPRAARNLGLLLAEQGDVEGARAAFQQAIASGHPDEAPRAARNLGLLLAEQGDAEGARAALQQAIASGHQDHAPMAARSLGDLLLRHGDVQGACAALQQAIASGHPNQAPRAAVNLGIALAKQRDVEGARSAFRQAIDSQHPDSAPQAAGNLGLLLAEQGDVEGARAAFQLAIESGHPDQASRAAVNLGALLAKAHDLVGARAAFQRVITTADEISDPDVRELARAALEPPAESTEHVEPHDSR